MAASEPINPRVRYAFGAALFLGLFVLEVVRLEYAERAGPWWLIALFLAFAIPTGLSGLFFLAGAVAPGRVTRVEEALEEKLGGDIPF